MSSPVARFFPRNPLHSTFRAGACLRLRASCHGVVLAPIATATATATVTAAATRASSSSASSRWKSRQGKDPYAREAKLQGLKSRAAFKLLEGFAPGSWSQVALERTKPHSHVLGIDLLPAQPPRGVSAIHGNFLSPHVQALVRESVREAHARRRAAARVRAAAESERANEASLEDAEMVGEQGVLQGAARAGGEDVLAERRSYVDMEKEEMRDVQGEEGDVVDDRVVNVVLSDMSEPWLSPADFRRDGMSNAYLRMMNTSGIPFRDHAGSMDLCSAALRFASDTLKNGGHFVCKFYQGSEDKEFEKRLRRMFDKVYREKPDSSRKESREAYFVALRRKRQITDE